MVFSTADWKVVSERNCWDADVSPWFGLLVPSFPFLSSFLQSAWDVRVRTMRRNVFWYKEDFIVTLSD